MKTTKRIKTLFMEPTNEQLKRLAVELAIQIDALNPNCQQIGAGYMANMRDKAKQILALVNQKTTA